MKRFYLLLALLMAPGFAFAQPDTKADTAPPAAPELPPNFPRFKINEDNLSALSLVGTFYGTLERAKSVQCELVLTKTFLDDEKPVGSRIVNWKSVWQGAGGAHFAQDHYKSQFTFTETKDGKTTTKDGIRMDDGKTTRRYLPSRQVWSVKPLDKPNDIAESLTAAVWSMALLGFTMGAEYQISEVAVKDQPTRLVLRNEGAMEMVFDKETRFLQSWKVKNDKEITELRIIDLKINQPLFPNAFTFVVPDDARQVEPGEMDFTVQF